MLRQSGVCFNVYVAGLFYVCALYSLWCVRKMHTTTGANGNRKFVNHIRINTSAIETLYSTDSNDFEYHLTFITSLVSSAIRYRELKTSVSLSRHGYPESLFSHITSMLAQNYHCRNYCVDYKWTNFINIDYIKTNRRAVSTSNRSTPACRRRDTTDRIFLRDFTLKTALEELWEREL